MMMPPLQLLRRSVSTCWFPCNLVKGDWISAVDPLDRRIGLQNQRESGSENMGYEAEVEDGYLD